ncbi:hypothetical protein EDB83DRAFT_2325011 [Lactarius deliciosus]|nr:hypothetical protein EDB83DRAFT_2325011 [Lactarius deliciosus]
MRAFARKQKEFFPRPEQTITIENDSTAASRQHIIMIITCTVDQDTLYRGTSDNNLGDVPKCRPHAPSTATTMTGTATGSTLPSSAPRPLSSDDGRDSDGTTHPHRPNNNGLQQLQGHSAPTLVPRTPNDSNGDDKGCNGRHSATDPGPAHARQPRDYPPPATCSINNDDNTLRTCGPLQRAPPMTTMEGTATAASTQWRG